MQHSAPELAKYVKEKHNESRDNHTIRLVQCLVDGAHAAMKKYEFRLMIVTCTQITCDRELPHHSLNSSTQCRARERVVRTTDTIVHAFASAGKQRCEWVRRSLCSQTNWRAGLERI